MGKEKKPKLVKSESCSEYVGYWISEDGNVYEREGMKPVTVYQNGTASLLHSSGVKMREPVHRLIAEAFVPKTAGARLVKFKDGDKKNRLPENLFWDMGTRTKSKATEEIIHLWKLGWKTTEIAGFFAKSPQYINRIIKDYKKHTQ